MMMKTRQYFSLEGEFVSQERLALEVTLKQTEVQNKLAVQKTKSQKELPCLPTIYW